MTQQTDSPIRVAGVVGSLRQASLNRALLRAAMTLQPAGMEIFDVDLRDLPLYDEDLEAAGGTPAVAAFQEQIRRADALLFVTPEYNYSIPGVLKNAIDWGSRPSGKGPMMRKPAAVMGCSTGPVGTRRAQLHLRTIFTTLDLWDLKKPEITLANAKSLFDEGGILTDDATRDQVRAMLDALAEWTRRFSAVGC